MTLACCKLQPDAAPEPTSHDVTPPQSSFQPTGIPRLGAPLLAPGGSSVVAEHPFFRPFPPKRHKVVCAWCQVVMSAGVEPVSHGICEACAAGLRARLAAERAVAKAVNRVSGNAV